MKVFNRRICVYVPSTIGDKPITISDFERRVKLVSSFFTKLVGGATIERTNGCFMAKDGKVITESIAIVSAWMSDKDYKLYKLILSKEFYSWKTVWGQESLMITLMDSKGEKGMLI